MKSVPDRPSSGEGCEEDTRGGCERKVLCKLYFVYVCVNFKVLPRPVYAVESSGFFCLFVF